MSEPSGRTVTSPREYSPRWAFLQYSSHPARSRARPEAFTPANVGAKWPSTLAQSWSWTPCHMRRSYCSAPVALFQPGCLAAPAQPTINRATAMIPIKRRIRTNLTTEYTEEHRENDGAPGSKYRLCYKPEYYFRAALPIKNVKATQGIKSLSGPLCTLWLTSVS